MLGNLTSSERQNALVLAAAVTFAGAAMAIMGRSDILGVHGVIAHWPPRRMHSVRSKPSSICRTTSPRLIFSGRRARAMPPVLPRAVVR